MSTAHFPEQYAGSPQLKVLRHAGDVRLTKQTGHEDYSVWTDGRVHAQGGKALMDKVFDKLTEAE